MIYVTLGTHEQPMRELSESLEKFPGLLPALGPFIIQHGYTPPPAGWQAFRMVAPIMNRAYMEEADIVVTHGGPATIAEARQAGSVPIVVPRRSAFAEHVDDHQIAYARRLAKAGEVILVEDPRQLATAVREFEDLSRQLPDPSPHDPTPAIRRLIRIVDGLVHRDR